MIFGGSYPLIKKSKFLDLSVRAALAPNVCGEFGQNPSSILGSGSASIHTHTHTHIHTFCKKTFFRLFVFREVIFRWKYEVDFFYEYNTFSKPKGEKVKHLLRSDEIQPDTSSQDKATENNDQN